MTILGNAWNARLAFLYSFILLPPDNVASNTQSSELSTIIFSAVGHGGIKFTVLFNDPTDLG
jgi:hypothetical protein